MAQVDHQNHEPTVIDGVDYPVVPPGCGMRHAGPVKRSRRAAGAATADQQHGKAIGRVVQRHRVDAVDRRPPAKRCPDSAVAVSSIVTSARSTSAYSSITAALVARMCSLDELPILVLPQIPVGVELVDQFGETSEQFRIEQRGSRPSVVR